MIVIQKRAFVVPFHLGTIDAPNRQIHLCQPPGSLIAFLSVNGNIIHFALMVGHKLFRLHKHATGTTTGVKHPAFVWLQHFYQQFNNASWSIELAAFFAFSQSKFTQEIFKHMPQHIGASGFGITQSNVSYKVNQTSKIGGVEIASGIDFRQHIPKRRIVLFNGIHSMVNLFADFRQFGFGLQIRPAGNFRHKKYILRLVFVLIFRVGAGIFSFTFFQLAK